MGTCYNMPNKWWQELNLNVPLFSETEVVRVGHCVFRTRFAQIATQIVTADAMKIATQIVMLTNHHKD
jgi:hypothetical protein